MVLVRMAAIFALVLGVTPQANSARTSQVDLVLQAITDPPSRGYPGMEFGLLAELKSAGSQASPATTVDFYLRRKTGTRVLIGTSKVLRLASGRISLPRETLNLPQSLAAGAFAMEACVDTANRIFERSESNNCVTARSMTQVVERGPDVPPDY